MEKVNIDEVIIKVLYTMQTVVEQQQLDTLKATLYMNFGKYQLFEEETALTTTLDDNNYIINLFLATLKIEGRTDKTIGAYTTEYRTFFLLLIRMCVMLQQTILECIWRTARLYVRIVM